eukprot:CAMPEP_0206369598 /NCGR_PEP_ID=MMETSP0294-20121207/5399_1 /ASSEMBLY_ACC=CAM_ASM_000327 /TAXON_ID=39354 /ORGANISM="Heterosigma akashiwo, Strain CCMP2393" /LENGTH=106 /DNA_ID=CAMNT_0053816397 /DNA_START=974 /DNA_END=1291 /DNA_ORIENTATION=+
MAQSLPPSSIWRGTIPALREAARPVLPPVKLRQSARGCVTRWSPISLPRPVTKFATPGGSPAASSAAPTYKQETLDHDRVPRHERGTDLGAAEVHGVVEGRHAEHH